LRRLAASSGEFQKRATVAHRAPAHRDLAYRRAAQLTDADWRRPIYRNVDDFCRAAKHDDLDDACRLAALAKRIFTKGAARRRRGSHTQLAGK
jgi:hypothetical protein